MSDKLRTLNVLIVDDNEGDRLLYKEHLTEGDPATEFVFDEAGTGKSALEKLATDEPQCLLLDYRLPDMHGLDILKKLSGQDGSLPVPVVMLTGFGDEATAVKAMHLGANEYIPKRDLTKETLCKAMNDSIRKHKKTREFEESRRQLEIQNRETADKYAKVEDFYKQVLGKLKSPVISSREISCQILDELRDSLSENQIVSLESIKNSCDQLAANITNLIDNPGLEMGEMLISSRTEDATEVVSGVLSSINPRIESKGIELSTLLASGLRNVSMDRYRIEQVLTNLLDNAIKFTAPGGRIEVSVKRLPESRDRVTFMISDTGQGIGSQYLEKIFDRAFQVPTGGIVNQSGLGLGLHICKEIILSHKGEIFATSTSDEGSCFTFTLPLSQLEDVDMSKVDVWSGGPISYP